MITLCGARLYECSCEKPKDHPGAHLCSCDGSWKGTHDNDDFEIVAMPSMRNAIAALFSNEWDPASWRL